MFKRGGKTKIILVIEQSTLFSARGGSLVDIAVRLRELFPKDFNSLVHSIMIVISKVNPDDFEEDDIVSKISSITNQNQNLPQECQMMLNTIVQFRRVVIFPYPKYMNPDKINEIKTRIRDLRDCILSEDATISLSPSAKIQLDDLARGVINNLNNCSKLMLVLISVCKVRQNYILR